MRKLFFAFLVIILFVCVGCGSDPNNNEPSKPVEPEKDIFEGITKEYELFEEGTIDFKEVFEGKLEGYTLSSESSLVEIKDNVLTALSKGNAEITLKVGDKTATIKINIKEKIDFSCDDIEIYEGETKKLDIKVKGCSLDDLSVIANDSNISVEKKDGTYVITGKTVGDSKVIITNGTITKEVYVQIKEVSIEVKNESLTVDIFETLELILDYPKEMINEEDITLTIAREGYFTIEGLTIIPIKEGKSRVKIQAGEVKKNIEITVSVDPIKIFTMLNQEEALMIKTVKLYGSTVEEQSFMGSVSRYMFADLNLVEDIIPIYDNPYIGEIATREIVDYLDKKKNTSVPGAPRTGVKMTSISYITYHDTANANSGADARANANWMVNQYSVTTTARSWHYTVDANQVIHSVPDDEITFQGDTYEAYTTSIGIETCVNKGTNLDKVWHRMGKLCAKLMVKYDIDVAHIKQHYDWMGKECPHTLRANGLYPYAISLVEGELMVKKYLSGYTITMESLTPEYLDNTGQIIKAPESEITVSYKVHITNDSGYDQEVILSTKVGPLK